MEKRNIIIISLGRVGSARAVASEHNLAALRTRKRETASGTGKKTTTETTKETTITWQLKATNNEPR